MCEWRAPALAGSLINLLQALSVLRRSYKGRGRQDLLVKTPPQMSKAWGLAFELAFL